MDHDAIGLCACIMMCYFQRLMETGEHGLRRELKLWDLVAIQVVLIVWLGWTGFAAKQGSSQMALWLMAIVLFYLPLAAVVMKLSRALPVEGGVYQWVKVGVSPFAGYMAGWNLTIFAISAFAVVGSLLANGIAHAAGSWGTALSASKPFALFLTTVACLIAFIFNMRGLQLAKWWSQAGALLTVATFLIMLYLLIRGRVTAAPLAQRAFSLEWPGFSILTLSVFTKMALSALSGFDNSAVFSEECRKPENDVARSVFIAAPLIALIYILGTSAVLAYIPPADVDLAASVPQLMQAAFGSNGLGHALTVIVVVAFSISFMASMVIITGMVARLPMVAGWDGLLPRWWSELHPTFRTPSKAIAVVTVSMMILGALSLLGAGNQEAVQVSVGAGGAALCTMYMLLFGVILFGFRASAVSSGVGIRLAALAGFSVALGALIFQIVPVGQVASPGLFGIKVAGTFCATNGLGAYLYWRGTRRTRT
jgi:amino acid transporter